MATPPRAAALAIAAAPVIPWAGRAWRIHRRKYDATSHRGSELVSGRFHRAPDRFPPEQCFPALYLSLAPEICIAELLRHTKPADIVSIREVRLSELRVRLAAVLNGRDLAALGLTRQMVLAPREYETGQQLAAAAIARGCEGLMVPSATTLGDNLIVFPTTRQAASRVEVVGHRDFDEVYYTGA